MAKRSSSPDPIQFLRGLSGDELAERLQAVRAEEKLIKILLRAALARERMQATAKPEGGPPNAA
jgi:hypothetical protein